MAATHREGRMIEVQGEMRFTDAELEFIAEDEIVEIVPRFRFQEVQLLSGNLGKFEVHSPSPRTENSRDPEDLRGWHAVPRALQPGGRAQGACFHLRATLFGSRWFL